MMEATAARWNPIIALVAVAVALVIGCDEAGTGGMDMAAAGRSVAVNEVFPHGSSGMDPDWAELKNLGDATIDLSGWQVRDQDVGNLFALPPGTSIAAHGYLIVYCDDQVDGGVAGGIHVPWKLGAKNGDELHLIGKDGVEVDAATFGGDVGSGKSWGRLPDGTGGFLETTPTPGESNH